MPSVPEALARLERELGLAQRERRVAVKLIHGYGSSGVGGDIRIAVQKRLREMVDAGQLSNCFFGEDWAKSCVEVWRLLQKHLDLKGDPDLGRGNRGITIVVL